jgi:hypothetical protein
MFEEVVGREGVGITAFQFLGITVYILYTIMVAFSSSWSVFAEVQRPKVRRLD